MINSKFLHFMYVIQYLPCSRIFNAYLNTTFHVLIIYIYIYICVCVCLLVIRLIMLDNDMKLVTVIHYLILISLLTPCTVLTSRALSRCVTLSSKSAITPFWASLFCNTPFGFIQCYMRRNLKRLYKKRLKKMKINTKT